MRWAAAAGRVACREGSPTTQLHFCLCMDPNWAPGTLGTSISCPAHLQALSRTSSEGWASIPLLMWCLSHSQNALPAHYKFIFLARCRFLGFPQREAALAVPSLSLSLLLTAAALGIARLPQDKEGANRSQQTLHWDPAGGRGALGSVCCTGAESGSDSSLLGFEQFGWIARISREQCSCLPSGQWNLPVCSKLQVSMLNAF